MIPDNDKLKPIKVGVVVTVKNGLPCLELRRATNDIKLIKVLTACAFHERPIIIFPAFRDKFDSLSSLLDKGILYKEGNNYYFTI